MPIPSENDNDAVDNDEFENLKRKVIRRSELKQNNEDSENVNNDE